MPGCPAWLSGWSARTKSAVMYRSPVRLNEASCLTIEVLATCSTEVTIVRLRWGMRLTWSAVTAAARRIEFSCPPSAHCCGHPCGQRRAAAPVTRPTRQRATPAPAAVDVDSRSVINVFRTRLGHAQNLASRRLDPRGIRGSGPECARTAKSWQEPSNRPETSRAGCARRSPPRPSHVRNCHMSETRRAMRTSSRSTVIRRAKRSAGGIVLF